MFADYEDFGKIFKRLPNSQFFRLNTDIAVKSSTNAYINTVRQITQQESKQVLKSIAKICGILTNL